MSNKVDVLDIMLMQSYIKIVVDRTDLRLEWKDDISQPLILGNTVYLPIPHTKMTKEQLQELKYFVLHASLHYTEGTDFGFIELHNLDPKNPLAAIFHMLEDHRIERAGALVYQGDAQLMDEAFPTVANNILENVKENVKDKDSDEAKMACAIEFDIHNRAAWLVAMKDMSGEYAAVLSSNGADVHRDKLYKHDFVNRLAALPTTMEALDLAKDMYNALEFSTTSEEEMEKMKKDKPEKGTGEPQGDDQEEGDVGEGEDGEGRGEANAGDEEGKGKSKKNAEKVDYSWSTQAIKSNSKGLGDITIDYSAWQYETTHGYQQQAFKDMNIIDLSKGVGIHGISGRKEQFERGIIESGAKGRGIATKVRRLLEISSKARVEHTKKKGKLDKKNIHRVGITHPALQSYASKVFKTKENKDILDTAVLVLVDVSGSMSGTKVVHAAVSASLLNDAISKSLRIPLEIQTFTHSRRGNVIHVVKKFDERLSEATFLSRMALACVEMNCNADGEAISYAEHCLLKRKEKRKICIVLSDGQPAGGSGGDIASYTKEVVEGIEKRGVIDIAAIGIKDTSVKEFYKHYDIINNAGDLESALLNTISKRIL